MDSSKNASLDIDVHNRAKGPWTKQQKRVFARLTSWCTEAVGRGCQLLRVDLTTATGGDARALRRHFQECRRRVEREFGYKGIEAFIVETDEGNGVLHMVWAWQGNRSFYIPQPWLSDCWLEIHGASIVWVRRMSIATADIKRVSRYFALQYLVNQGIALVRISWSWGRSRVSLSQGWKTLVKVFCNRRENSHYARHHPSFVPVSFDDLLGAWGNILFHGKTVFANMIFVCQSRKVVNLFHG